MERIIAHIDMDAFFAAIAERDRPWLSGFPIVIGADPQGGIGRGVVSTANYKAREYGIHSALPIQKAWRLSELARIRGEQQVIFLTPEFKVYEKASKKVFAIVSGYSDIMQITSIDEAYIDLSYLKSFKKAEKVCLEIKEKIRQTVQVTCSIGIGPNKMIAKIASSIQKPDGLTSVTEEEVFDFLAPLSIKEIPGVGPKTYAILAKKKIYSVLDARTFSWEELSDLFGLFGFNLYQKVRGIDDATLTDSPVRKSIGCHETFMHDTGEMSIIFDRLLYMSKKIARMVHSKKFNGFRTVVFTIRFSDFETKIRSVTFSKFLHDATALYLCSIKLALPFFERAHNPHNEGIRMIGLRVEKLV